jgi:DNA-binding response OmpR family regulator
MSQPFLLIIEDDDSISLALKVFFEGRGYSVMSASNEKTA